MLLLLLTLLLHSEPARAVPAPPQCPWVFGGPEALMPFGSTVPRNTSFWVREYGSGNELQVIDLTTGSSVAVDQIAIELTSTGGRLIEVRPKSLLKAETRYQLELGIPGSNSSYTTTSTLDEVPPVKPNVSGSRPITSPYEICETAGIIIDVTDPGEPVLHLIAAPDGSLLEVGASFGYPQPNRVVPTEAGETVEFQVIAIDLAGNRADAKANGSARAGAVPRVVGNQQVVGDPPGGERGGCVCLTPNASGHAGSWILLALALLCFRVPDRRSRRPARQRRR